MTSSIIVIISNALFGRYLSLSEPGEHLKNTFELVNLGDRKFYLSINFIYFNGWVRYFVWTVKENPWNSTENTLTPTSKETISIQYWKLKSSQTHLTPTHPAPNPHISSGTHNKFLEWYLD